MNVRSVFARPAAAAVSTVVAVAAVSVALLSPVGATPNSRPMHGNLTSQVTSGPGCASPIGLCATGEVTGSLNGPFEFVAYRLIPADRPDVFFMTGVSIIHDTHGDVRCEDSAALNTAPGSDGELVGLCEIAGGTGKWQGASGYIQSAGTFSPVSGGAETYSGKIVLP